MSFHIHQVNTERRRGGRTWSVTVLEDGLSWAGSPIPNDLPPEVITTLTNWLHDVVAS